MASRKDIETTYSYMDEFWRLCIGDCADITCAMYNGNYNQTLEQAQICKHHYILKNIQFKPGNRVLDIGCGWGGLLRTIKSNGGDGLGLTLSTRQQRSCLKLGFNVYLLDWKDVNTSQFPKFDSIVSVGAFEHFCSEDEWREGKQVMVYKEFFKTCNNLLSYGRRLFLQTMLWGRKAPIDKNRISLQAERGSDEYILALLRKFYPGSWLPLGISQIVECAQPYFQLISTSNGRKDYIETMHQWDKKLGKFNTGKFLAFIKSIPYLILDKDIFYKLEVIRNSYNRECFVRELFDHERIVLEKC
jgi:cyclopropane-fatty-acyl-phospholipid synthase